ncbi:uncharacterized protein NPIL_14501 [Nephila pilipes]|uniref:Uncharacterized protein n=1 Tax=Nephila pilipes TaxID=299642 RepID=A0A8X6QTJ4_NEPPI|nr:uncharacterized protein NPIL_14501 [Nephila pilipes]
MSPGLQESEYDHLLSSSSRSESPKHHRRKTFRERWANGPDCLLSWLVALANFLINFIVVGLGRMSGILYVVFMQIYDADREAASVPFSVQQAARNLFGPVAGIMGQKYGVRSVTVVGGFIGAVSAAACFFATSITSITVLWGLIFGLCTALTTTLNQVPIDEYFEKHRTTAGGLAFSGGCVGAFFFPVVLELLIDRYGMSGTFLVMGAIILNVVPASLVLKHPPWKKSESKPTTDDKSVNYNTFSPPRTPRRTSTDSRKSFTFPVIASRDLNFAVLRDNSEFVYQLFRLTISPESLELDANFVDTGPIINELEDLYKFLNDFGEPRRSSMEMCSIMDELTQSVHQVKVKCETVNDSEELEANHEVVGFRSWEDNPRWLFLIIKIKELCENFTEEDIFQIFPTPAHNAVKKILNVLNNLNEMVAQSEKASLEAKNDSKSNSVCSGANSKVDPNNIATSDLPNGQDISRSSRKTTDKVHSNSFWEHIKTAIRLHKNPIFLLISLCRGVFMLTFLPMVTIIVDFAMDMGIHRDSGKYVIAILSLGDLVGRLCLGWITDSGCLNLPAYMVIAMILLGISNATLPMMHSELSLMPAVFCFGMLQGSLFIRHQVLVSKYMEKHEQTIGMGFINFLSGILGFAIPYYVGYFRDTLGSYDKMMYLNGAISAGVGILWAFEPLLRRFSSPPQYERLPDP